jgi:hypothetical protein
MFIPVIGSIFGDSGKGLSFREGRRVRTGPTNGPEENPGKQLRRGSSYCSCSQRLTIGAAVSIRLRDAAQGRDWTANATRHDIL